MVKEIKSNVFGTALNDSRIEDKVEECAQRMMHKHQADTARAIAELRRIVTREHNYDQQEYQREPHTIERKSSEKALSNSRSKPNIQRSGQKSNRASHT
jgi:Mg2+ and Co2+ transporter CorA